MNELIEYKIEPYTDFADAIIVIERIAKIEQLTGWKLAYAVHQMLKQFGNTKETINAIYEDVAVQIGRSEKRLRNLVSAIRNPMAEEAFQAGLTIDAFLEIAPVAKDLPEAAAHYIAEASAQAMTVDEVRRMVNTPTAATVETFPTSGNRYRDDAPAVIDEQRTGVWIRNDMTPEQVYDELTQIFDIDWTERFVNLVSTGEIAE